MTYLCIVCKSKRSGFNFEGESPKYCNGCKADGMIDVINPKCIICKRKRSIYNFEGKPPKYCADCKENDMINVISPKCIKCKRKQSYFNFKGLRAEYCNGCKADGMIDVRSIKCIICKRKQPTFNFEGESAKYCTDCKKDDMIDVLNPKCITCNVKRPYFNFEGKPYKYCKSCSQEGMIDVRSIKCKGTLCETQVHFKYDGYCTHCFKHMFPNDPRTKNMYNKTKEFIVREYINENFDGFEHDKVMHVGGCDCTNRHRIDHRILIGNTLLAIETDENQHKWYDKTSENERYDNMFMVHGGKWIWIRFNPDSYKDNNGIRKNPDIKSRLETLGKEIRKQMGRIKNDENTEMHEIIKLFYDS